jgi:hypothetical protein
VKATHLSGRGTARKLLDKCHANAQCVRERVAQLEDFTKVPPATRPARAPSLSVAPLLGRGLLNMTLSRLLRIERQGALCIHQWGYVVVWSDLSVLSLVLVGGRR